MLPKRLTAVTDEDLMDLLAEYARWLDHVGALLFLQEIDERNAEETLAALQAGAYEVAVQEIGGSRRSEASVTRAKAIRDSDPEVDNARAELRQTYAWRKGLQNLYTSLERGSFLLSREITRRIGREGVDTRHARLAM